MGHSTAPQYAPEYLQYLSHRAEHLDQARHDVNAFAEYCFRDNKGAALRQGKMHRRWQKALDSHKRAVIIGPRLHGKTIQICQARPLFELGQDPDICIKVIGSNDHQAIKRVKALRNHMENNRDLHRVFPHLRHHVKRGGRRPENVPEIGPKSGDWNLGSLTIAGRKKWWLLDPSVQAKSVMASISGDRADILIWDDGADRRNSVELPRMRSRIVEGVDDFVNTLHPETGRAWAIGTLWHESDLNHHFMKIWPTYWYEIVTKQGPDGYNFESFTRHHDGFEEHSPDPLWSHWNQARLLERLQDIGMRKFLRGFGNKPMHQDEIHISPDWITYWDDPPGKDWRIIISVDAASTTGASSNYTGFCFLAIHPVVAAGLIPATGHRGAIKCFQAYHRKVTAPDRVRKIEKTYQRLTGLGYQVDGVAIENRGGGQETMDFLLEHKIVPEKKILPVRPVSRKTDRVDRISHYVENGTVQFSPTMDPGLGGANVKADDGNVISELLSVPLGEYDDLADSFSQGVWVSMQFYEALRDLAAAAAADLDDDDPGRPRVEQTASGGRLYVF
jgi:hypothetical protein